MSPSLARTFQGERGLKRKKIGDHFPRRCEFLFFLQGFFPFSCMRFYSENLGFKGKSCDTFFPANFFPAKKRSGKKYRRKTLPLGTHRKRRGSRSKLAFSREKKGSDGDQIRYLLFFLLLPPPNPQTSHNPPFLPLPSLNLVVCLLHISGSVLGGPPLLQKPKPKDLPNK